MSRQYHFGSYPDTLEHVVPVRQYLWQYLIAKGSPFQPVAKWRHIVFKVLLAALQFFECLVGTPFFVRNDLRDLFSLDSRARRVLKDLIEKKIVLSWQLQPVQPDLPPVTHCVLILGDHVVPSGRKYTIQGNRGEGVGHTFNEAMIPALAEALERQSLCTWRDASITRGSYHELKKQGAVSPEEFVVYTSKQTESARLRSGNITKDTVLGWVRAHSLTENKDGFVPAQPVYINYDLEHPDEPVFSSATTNGAAAGACLDSAVSRAILEAIERDGFLIYWLNRLAPKKVIIEGSPKLEGIIQNFSSYGLETYILDTSMEIGVPSFCGIIVDRNGSKAVSVAAGAGFNVEETIEKLLWDTLKHVHLGEGLRAELSKFTKIKDGILDVRPFEHRKILWSDVSMTGELDFFLQGEETSLTELIKSQSRSLTYKEQVRFLKNKMKELSFKCYLVEVTSREARHAGLRVMKALIPQVVPIYFDERAKPLGVKRIATAPVVMGIRSEPIIVESEINMLPHPFI